MKIAFDIRGTLLRATAEETQTMIGFLKILKQAGHYIIVWSGGDLAEIKEFVIQNKLEKYIDLMFSKENFKQEDLPDVSFDDNEYAYANKITIKV